MIYIRAFYFKYNFKLKRFILIFAVFTSKLQHNKQKNIKNEHSNRSLFGRHVLQRRLVNWYGFAETGASGL